MPAGVAEDFDEQIGAAVDHFRRVVELRRRIDHAEELDDVIDAVERAERVAHGGGRPARDDPRASIPFLDAEAGAELAGGAFAVCSARPWAGEKKKMAGEPIRQ